MIELLLVGALIILVLINLRVGVVNTFKISYYEQKLKNRDVDISHIENITLKDIWKL